jgi:DNA helicase-2/ATP-dependent DNA helicase PcrA
LAVYKKMYSQLENVPEEKIKTCVIFVALRGGINTGKSSSSVEYGTRDVFGTFEGHLQKVLAWKQNPDEFIQELVDLDARDTLHEAIKEKLDSSSN